MCKRYISGSMAWLLVFAAGFGLRAQEPSRGWNLPIEARPVLILGTAAWSFANLPLLENESFGFMLQPTFRASGDLCASGITVGLSQDLTTATAAWYVEGRLVELRDGEATFELKWARQVNRLDISPAGSFSSEQRVTVREGESRMLDLVRTTTPGAECPTFGLTYELQFQGPDPLSGAALGYDLWLVQRDADGELVTDRYQITARQGQQVEYFFRPLRFTAAGRRTAPGTEAFVMNVAGDIRGRIRSDGEIDLTVNAMRGFSVASGGVSAHGRTLVTVKPGETIELPIDLPMSSLPQLGDVNQVFGNHRTAVRVTARRLW